jgi:hypothetical protein
MGGHHIKVAKLGIKPAMFSPPLTGYYLAIFLVDKVAISRGRSSPYPLLFKGGVNKPPYFFPPCGS